MANVPDWLIYFEAELASFTGVVTKDWHQSVQAEEAFAIAHTKLAVVTWRSPPDDPVVEWAMVIAYMPEVKKILAGRRDPPFIFLPSPHLDVTAATSVSVTRPSVSSRRSGQYPTLKPAGRLTPALWST